MAIIRKSGSLKTVENTKNSVSKKKESGLGRGLQSLLDDNAPDISPKAAVVRRTDAADRENSRKTSDDLYRKEGVMNVKKVKRTWS